MKLNSELAERNRIKTVPLLAPRGKILDRDGRVIVDNHAAFTLRLARGKSEAGTHRRDRRRACIWTPKICAPRLKRFDIAAEIRADDDQAGADAGRAGVRRIASRRRRPFPKWS